MPRLVAVPPIFPAMGPLMHCTRRTSATLRRRSHVVLCLCVALMPIAQFPESRLACDQGCVFGEGVKEAEGERFAYLTV